MLVIAVGQVIWLWNVLQSWMEAPALETGDPWGLDERNQRTHEWRWHERRVETAIADGGERPTGSVDTADGTDADGTAELVVDEGE